MFVIERLVEGTVRRVLKSRRGQPRKELSFRKKLIGLRAEKILKLAKSRAHEKEKRKVEKKKEKERAVGLEKLFRIARKELFPKFELVNRFYLNRKGELSLEEEEDYENPTVFLELSWNQEDFGDRSDDETPGPRLWARLDQKLNVSVFGGGFAPESEFNLGDEGWEEQLKEGILRILSFPKGCSWTGV